MKLTALSKSLRAKIVLASSCVAISCLAIVCPSTTANEPATAPVIFNWSNIAAAGDVVNLQGQALGKDCEVWCSINGATPLKLPLVNSGNGVVHVKMPGPQGLYSLSIKNGTATSNTVYVNRANPMHYDSPEVAAGGAFRIFGRNLFCPGFQPQVKLISGSRSYSGKVPVNTRISSYNQLFVQIPANIPPGSYTVQVSNGMGSWSQASAQMKEVLAVRVAGPDTFNLKVPWAANLTFGNNVYNVKTDKRLALHAAGDGKQNDQLAIQQAIDAASTTGGGVVYLPAGTYKLQVGSGPLMDFKNNVVVRGASAATTAIKYGYGRPGPHFYLAMFSQASRCGLCDLSVQNQNEENAWLDAGSIGNSGNRANELFLARLNGNFQNSARVELKGDRIVVEHCNLRSIYSLLHLGTCTNSRVFNNSLTQMLGVHLDLTESNQCIVENNIFNLEANQGHIIKGTVRHGLAIGFACNLAILNNEWRSFGGIPGSNNDGEAILSEGGGGIRTGEETGTVKDSADSSVNLSKKGQFIAGSVIAVIHGKGMGQWRRITGREGDKIILDAPWAVAPDSSSNYAIFAWSSRNATIAGNRFTNWLRGVWLYQASTTDTQISKNRFNQMDGIFIEPCQNVLSGNGQFNPVWNTLVDHNILSSGATATEINLTGDLQQTTKLIGTMALNDQVYANTVIGNGSKHFENDPAWAEGFCNYLRVEASPFEDERIPAMLGTVFQRNVNENCGEQSYLVNGGSYQTTIADYSEHELQKVLSNSERYWNTPGQRASVDTVLFQPNGRMKMR